MLSAGGSSPIPRPSSSQVSDSAAVSSASSVYDPFAQVQPYRDERAARRAFDAQKLLATTAPEQLDSTDAPAASTASGSTFENSPAAERVARVSGFKYLGYRKLASCFRAGVYRTRGALRHIKLGSDAFDDQQPYIGHCC